MEDTQLDRLEAKIDKIGDRLSKIELTQVAQHITLVDHTDRSTKLENIVIPLKSDVDKFKGAMQLIGIIGVLAGVGDVILRLFSH